MNYDKGFEQGQLVDQHYNPPTGDESDEYIEGWVDGRMEAIRIEDPDTADRFEQIFLGSEGFGKATYRDMLAFLTAEQPGHPMTNEKRFRQRLMYRMMQIMAREQPRRLGQMIEAISTHSPEFFDPDAASNAGPHFVHPYTEFTDEMRQELQMSDEDYERISDDVRQTLHEDW